MREYAFTDYFESEVLRKRPYLKKEWCIQVCKNAVKVEEQEHNCYRFRGHVKSSTTESCEGSHSRINNDT